MEEAIVSDSSKWHNTKIWNLWVTNVIHLTTTDMFFRLKKPWRIADAAYGDLLIISSGTISDHEKINLSLFDILKLLTTDSKKIVWQS